MAWLALDDQFYEHKRVRDLSHAAFRLHVAALCLCSRLLTDGLITDYELRLLSTGTKTKPRQVTELESAGLWKRCENGHEIRDFHDYNPTSEEVKERRRQNAERQKQWRSRNSNGVTNGVTNAVSNAAPSPPLPYKRTTLRREPVENALSCPRCGLGFVTEKRLLEHIENVHQEAA